MNTDLLIAHGNQCREQNQPEQALSYYAQAFVQDFNCVHAWNNYGNVIREMGYPERAIPFLQQTLAIDPGHVTASFNLAVCYLLLGNYTQGWQQYESRWQFEHLAGTLPQLPQPRWTGQDLKDKTVLVMGEQGHGDNIQFSRFLVHLHNIGARIKFLVTDGLVELFRSSTILDFVGTYADDPGHYDYWVPIMSIPGNIGLTLENLPQDLSYIVANTQTSQAWQTVLGPKKKLRVGFCWSGRRDTWLNRHKGIPFETIYNFVKQHPDYEWINLQIDATEQEEEMLSAVGVRRFPGAFRTFQDTAGLLNNLDLILGVDTAVSHLAGAMGRPTWLMLNHYAVDWRWLLNRSDSPWYPSVKLFRQPTMGDWNSVMSNLNKWLPLFKV